MTNDSSLLRLYVVVLSVLSLAVVPQVLNGDRIAGIGVLFAVCLVWRCVRVLSARKRVLAEHGSFDNLRAKIAQTKAELVALEKKHATCNRCRRQIDGAAVCPFCAAPSGVVTQQT